MRKTVLAKTRLVKWGSSRRRRSVESVKNRVMSRSAQIVQVFFTLRVRSKNLRSRKPALFQHRLKFRSRRHARQPALDANRLEKMFRLPRRRALAGEPGGDDATSARTQEAPDFAE